LDYPKCNPSWCKNCRDEGGNGGGGGTGRIAPSNRSFGKPDPGKLVGKGLLQKIFRKLMGYGDKRDYLSKEAMEALLGDSDSQNSEALQRQCKDRNPKDKDTSQSPSSSMNVAATICVKNGGIMVHPRIAEEIIGFLPGHFMTTQLLLRQKRKEKWAKKKISKEYRAKRRDAQKEQQKRATREDYTCAGQGYVGRGGAGNAQDKKEARRKKKNLKALREGRLLCKNQCGKSFKPTTKGEKSKSHEKHEEKCLFANPDAGTGASGGRTDDE
jgi:hypothetical protein